MIAISVTLLIATHARSRVRLPLPSNSSASLPQPWDETRRPGGIGSIDVAELPQDFLLLSSGQPNIHPNQDREHQQRQNRGPLQQEAKHDHNERTVLRVAHMRIGSRRGELLVSLCCEQHLPGGGKYDEPAEDENVAQDV